jgi:tetratricopeptide (TPR) repeat protein
MENLYEEGRPLMEEKKYPEAIEKFTAALKAFDDPKEKARYKSKEMADYKLAWNYQCRAYCLLQMKDYQRGVSDLDQAIKLRPDYKENYDNRARALTVLGRKDEAKADEDKASHIKPDDMSELYK